MEIPSFEVQKFVGKGCYSLVYEAKISPESEVNEVFAFKRLYLLEPLAVLCALREKNAYKKLAENKHSCPFIPVLFYSFLVQGSPVFIFEMGSGFDLYDIITKYHRLSESDTRFYASEIVCGLNHLHKTNLVHLDLKPENILLSVSGHVLITDFDRVYDIDASGGSPRTGDFGGTYLFMAPEVAKEEEISTKSDIWSLGVLVAELVTGCVRKISRNCEVERKMAMEGRIHLKELKNLSRPLQGFFNACLRKNPKARPDIDGVKNLRFFKHVKWDDVEAGKKQPPFHPSTLAGCITKNGGVDPIDQRLLKAAWSPFMPRIRGRLEEYVDDTGTHQLVIEPIKTEKMRGRFSAESIAKIFSDFEFVHPSRRSPTNGSVEAAKAAFESLSLECAKE